MNVIDNYDWNNNFILNDRIDLYVVLPSFPSAFRSRQYDGRRALFGPGPSIRARKYLMGRHGVEYLYRMSIYYNVLVAERDNNSIERQRLTGIGHDFVE